MSLRQRHIDPQLAMGSQRFVESCLSAGQQGEGSFPLRPRAMLRQARSQSFGQLPPTPLSSTVSHPSVVSSYGLDPHPLSSSCLSSSVGVAAPYLSHLFHTSFQPMDPIPDLSFSETLNVHSCSDSLGYPSSCSAPLRNNVCGCLFHQLLVFYPYHVQTMFVSHQNVFFLLHL